MMCSKTIRCLLLAPLLALLAPLSSSHGPLHAQQRAKQDTVLYHAGDTYDTPEYTTRYLGMATLPLGNNRLWKEGSCVTLLFEVTYLDTPGSVSVFRPAVTGFFTDGREAEKDQTGVGCGISGMKALGYESGPRRVFKKGETAKVFVGAVYIPPADSGKLAFATLYRDARVRMAVEIVEDATKGRP